MNLVGWFSWICKTLFAIFKKINNLHHLNYNKSDHKTHFLSDSNYYMFRHLGAIINEFINNNVL